MIQINPAPNFEIEQSQQGIGAIDAIGLMIGDKPVNHRLPKEPAPLDHFGRQQAPQQGGKFILEPGAHWGTEATFFSIQDVLGKEITQGFLQDMFKAAAAHFDRSGHGGGQFHELMVQQRNPALK